MGPGIAGRRRVVTSGSGDGPGPFHALVWNRGSERARGMYVWAHDALTFFAGALR